MTLRRYGLDCVTGCFPDRGPQIRRLCLSDPSFRHLCEEYALARSCLGRFEAMGEATRGEEINEYRILVAELKGEIARFFTRSD